jgi:hypothetical protein
MAPQLRQLNVSYVEVEDRLLLKMSTSDDQEYRAWCTRRYTRLLLERLEVLFETEVSEEKTLPSEARKDMARIQHSSSVSEDAFTQSYEAEPVSYPLGEEGVLLTRISYKRSERGVLMLSLSGEGGTGLTLNMNSKLQHHLYEIFDRASRRAGWLEGSRPPGAPVVH